MKAIDKELRAHNIDGVAVEVTPEYVIVNQSVEGDSRTTLAAYLRDGYKKLARVMLEGFETALLAVKDLLAKSLRFIHPAPLPGEEHPFIRVHRRGGREGGGKAPIRTGVVKQAW